MTGRNAEPQSPATGVVGWPQPAPPGRALGWAGDLRPATAVEKVIPPAKR